MRNFAVWILLFASSLNAVNTYDLQVAMQPKKQNAPIKESPKLNPSELRGELTAILTNNYSEPNIVVDVDATGLVTLFNMPSSSRLRESIFTYIKNYPKVSAVQIVDSKGYQPVVPIKWLGFPKTLLFYPLIANPLEVETSLAAFLANAKISVNSKNSLQTVFSVGCYIPIIRWFNRYNQKKTMQLNFEGANLSVLEIYPTTNLFEMSYRVGLNYTISTEILSYRISLYHICSHLGDKIALKLSKEGTFPRSKFVDIYPLEFVVSAQSTKDFRLYFGGGMGTYRQNATYFLYGTEFYFYEFKPKQSKLFYQPFFALDFQNWERFNYDMSLTAKLGISWGQLPMASKQGKFALTYHDGLGFGPYLFDRQKYVTAGIEYGF